MTGRELLLLLATAAVGLCAWFAIRTLDDGPVDEEVEPAKAAVHPAGPPLRTESEPAAGVPTPPPAPHRAPSRKAAPTAEPRTGLEAADAALHRLAQLLRNAKALNEDLEAALDDVHRFYLRPPSPPDGVPDARPDETREPALAVAHAANLRLLAEEERWPRHYEQDVLAWRRKAEKLFLKALKLQRMYPDTSVNLREDLNIKAAQVLASTDNPKLSPKIIRVLESTILKAKYEVTQTLYDESFGALAQLAHPDSLEWMREEFIHSKSSPHTVVVHLTAAHKAMRRFDLDKVAGSERYELVKEMIKVYTGVESAASGTERSDRARTMRRLWDRIRVGVIRAVRHFAYDPRANTGEPLTTMAEFQAWFREHKHPRKPPWRSD